MYVSNRVYSYQYLIYLMSWRNTYRGWVRFRLTIWNFRATKFRKGVPLVWECITRVAVGYFTNTIHLQLRHGEAIASQRIVWGNYSFMAKRTVIKPQVRVVWVSYRIPYFCRCSESAMHYIWQNRPRRSKSIIITKNRCPFLMQYRQ